MQRQSVRVGTVFLESREDLDDIHHHLYDLPRERFEGEEWARYEFIQNECTRNVMVTIYRLPDDTSMIHRMEVPRPEYFSECNRDIRCKLTESDDYREEIKQEGGKLAWHADLDELSSDLDNIFAQADQALKIKILDLLSESSTEEAFRCLFTLLDHDEIIEGVEPPSFEAGTLQGDAFEVSVLASTSLIYKGNEPLLKEDLDLMDDYIEVFLSGICESDFDSYDPRNSYVADYGPIFSNEVAGVMLGLEDYVQECEEEDDSDEEDEDEDIEYREMYENPLLSKIHDVFDQYGIQF